jgi:ureidoglycolate hydrolase
MDKNCTVQQLRPESFESFGSLIDISPGKPPTFEADFFTYFDSVALCDTGGKASFSILTILPRPLYLDTIEKHKSTPEVMISINCDVIFIVAHSKTDILGVEKELPDPETAEAFLLKAGQGVIMNAGVWHWVPFTESEQARMIFMYKQGTVQTGDALSLDLKEELGLRFTVGFPAAER